MDVIQSFLEEHGGRIAGYLFWAFLALLVFGIYRLECVSLPMQKTDYDTALQSYTADKAVAYYDYAQDLYRSGDYVDAVKLLSRAKEGCVDNSGQVDPARKELLAEIHFLQGNCLVRMMKKAEAAGDQDAQKLKDKAIRSYEESLRLNPQHWYAKYNLELLRKPPDSAAGGGGQDNPNQQNDQKTDPKDPKKDQKDPKDQKKDQKTQPKPDKKPSQGHGGPPEGI